MIRIFSHYVSKKVLLLLAVEAWLLAMSIYLGVSVRFPAAGVADPLYPLWPKAAAFVVIMLITMTALGLYQSELRVNLRSILLRLLVAFVIGLGLMSLIYYLVPSLYVGRGVFGIAYAAALGGVVLERLAFFRWTTAARLPKQRIMVLGAGTRAAAVEEAIRSRASGDDLEIVGFLPMGAYPAAVEPARILSAEGTLLGTARRYGIDEIVLAVRDRRGGNLPVRELLECRLRGIRVTELSSFFERERGQVRLDSLNPSWMILGEGFRNGLWRDAVKRLFDLWASAALLVVSAPAMLVAALCILVEDGAPVFYRQERVGQGGRLFTIIKFRSMRHDAERDGTPRWAGSNDDRTTRVGRIIRKLRIDELPQIFNVLKGEMSFVGPRPERPYFVHQLTAQIPYYAVRHSVKPGITGWAQVRYAYGASVEDAAEKLQYDLYYVKNHSLFLDLVILIETVQVVLWGKGAR
jgi:sugar transferase (PEP-CTERM system associated)